MSVAVLAGLDFMWRVVLDHPNQALLLHTDQRSPADLLVEICIMHRPTQVDRQAFVRQVCSPTEGFRETCTVHSLVQANCQADVQDWQATLLLQVPLLESGVCLFVLAVNALAQLKGATLQLA